MRLLALILTCWAGLSAMDDSWRPAVEARIRQHRCGALVITVADHEGRPRAEVPVELRLRRHAFRFGTAVSLRKLAELPEDHPYKTWLPQLFNCAVPENGLKWSFWERAEQRPALEAGLRWLREHGLALRGHCMVWATPRQKYGSPTPYDVHEAIARGDEEAKAYVRKRVDNHIAAIGSAYPDIFAWDVVNEQVREHELTAFLSPETPIAGSPDLARWFHLARAAAPQARLYLNDFHLLVGDFTEHKDTFEGIVREALAAGAPIDGLGFQAHFHAQTLLPDQDLLWATLERFAALGPDLSVTEYDCMGSNWPQDRDQREAMEAAFLERFLSTCFSHPRMSAFLMWGFWDGSHWKQNAPLFREDWSPKPALEVWRRLLFDEWSTHAAGRSDAAGRFVVEAAFYGDYELVIGEGETQIVVEASHRSSGTELRLTLPRE